MGLYGRLLPPKSNRVPPNYILFCWQMLSDSLQICVLHKIGPLIESSSHPATKSQLGLTRSHYMILNLRGCVSSTAAKPDTNWRSQLTGKFRIQIIKNNSHAYRTLEHNLGAHGKKLLSLLALCKGSRLIWRHQRPGHLFLQLSNDGPIALGRHR